MKTLIVEDDLTSRLLLQDILKNYGDTHVAVNGREAVEATRMALNSSKLYDLICLDIMMPEMDGLAALKQIRALEEAGGVIPSRGAKIIMTTILDDPKNVISAFGNLCDMYLRKPIDKAKLLDALYKLDLLA